MVSGRRTWLNLFLSASILYFADQMPRIAYWMCVIWSKNVVPIWMAGGNGPIEQQLAKARHHLNSERTDYVLGFAQDVSYFFHPWI